MIEFFSISNKMETTEAEAMKDVMNLLETEPPSDLSSRTARNSGGEWKIVKSSLEFNLPKNKLRGFQKKMLRNILNVMRLLFHQRLVTQLLMHLFNSVAEV